VFFSEHFFGENVMLTVATKQAHNPAAAVAKTLSLPLERFIVPKLHLPMKLIWGNMMLGLGDMVVPGLLVSFALRFDQSKESLYVGQCSRKRYFVFSMVGYSVGLMLSMMAAFSFQTAQPALLYLVPCTLLPVIVLGFIREELGELWNGLSDSEQDKYSN